MTGLILSVGLEKGPYAAPPNMGAPPPGGPYKDTPTYPQQPPYGYASSSMPPPEQHVPTNPDTDPFVKGFEFSTESIRRGFIRKVYSILSVSIHTLHATHVTKSSLTKIIQNFANRR